MKPIAQNWPYHPGLEYTPPARGTWTIAHTPLLVPDSVEIYVCPESCLRGVSLSAAEFGGLGTRFSLVVVEEEDWNRSRMEPLFIEGISDLLRQRFERDGRYPPICFVFNSCMHQFMDTNMNYIFRHLQERFPDVLFVEGNMNCTMRTTQTHYEAATFRALYRGLLPLGDAHRHPSSVTPNDTRPAVNVIGNYFALEENSELLELLRFAGYRVNDLPNIRTYDEYQQMADAVLNLYTHPFGHSACEDLEKRLGTPFSEVPYTWDFDEIEQTERAFLERAVSLVNGGAVNGPAGGFTPILRASLLTPYRKEAEAALAEAAARLSGWSIAIDAAATPRPFGLAALLETHGIRVTTVYADACGDADAAAKARWEAVAAAHGHAAATLPMIDFRMRYEPRGAVSEGDVKFLAIGQKAAYYTATEHFVNMIYQSGLLGYRGVTKLCALMTKAAEHTQDTKAVISVKAIGCAERVAADLAAAEEAWSVPRSGVKSKAGSADRLKEAEQASLYAVNTSSDLSGVCSALYELGGLIVMHDASGCNSTYATHDEPRWYDTDSLIFISGLREYDAILGNDEKYIRDVCEAAAETHPKFIAVFGSPIAAMTGTDFKGIARVIEKRAGIRTLHFDTSGMHTYQAGMRQAFRALAEQFVDEREEAARADSPMTADGIPEPDPRDIHCAQGHCYVDAKADAILAAQKRQSSTASLKLNLLGLTPLDFSVVGNVEALLDWCNAQHFEVISSWAMNPSYGKDLASLASISHSADADVNLVLSSTALDAAHVLYERFGTPYVIGLPMGDAACARITDLLKEAALTGENKCLWDEAAPFTENESGCSTGEHPGPLSTEVSGRKTGEKAPGAAPRSFAGKERTLIIGEPVYAASLRWVLEQAAASEGTAQELDSEDSCEHSSEVGSERPVPHTARIRVLNPLEDPCGCLRDTDLTSWHEPVIKKAILEADNIYADPLYRNLLPALQERMQQKCEPRERNQPASGQTACEQQELSRPPKCFHDMPSESYSGRMYRDRMSVILGPDAELKF